MSYRTNGHANGVNGTSEHASPERKGPPRRLPASDDPLDDLEDGPLLSDPSRSAPSLRDICDIRADYPGEAHGTAHSAQCS